MRPPGTFLPVTGTPRSAATRRMRFFIVVGLVPFGIVMRAASLPKDWMFSLEGVIDLRVHAGSAAHLAGFVEGDIFGREGR